MRSSPLDPGQFGAFCEFLSSRFPKLSDQRKARIQSIPPGDLGALARILSVDDQALSAYMARFLKVEYLAAIDHDQLQLGVLPTAFSRANGVVAVDVPDSGLRLVLHNPFDTNLADALRPILARMDNAQIAIASGQTIAEVLDYDPGAKKANIDELQREVFEEADAAREQDERDGRQAQVAKERVEVAAGPVVKLVNRIIEEAHERRASDIHIEGAAEEVIIRYRIDGRLQTVHRIEPPSVLKQIAARIKVMGEIDVAERRLPQDGRIEFKRFSESSLDVDLRIATAPMQFGEKIVMRLLDKHAVLMPLPELGFSRRDLERYRDAIRAPYGLVLHVGPTGSGKSMALYAALNEINGPELNIQTIEDPVEYTLAGVNQLQVHPEIGLNFSRALRSYLRQDPDVILVGEMRDTETAQSAIGAALTGHLVFSTLHTNDAPSTITRLVELGVQPFVVGSTLVLICAQRLVRRLCGACKVPVPAPAEWAELAGRAATFFGPGGCEDCGDTGYRGRIGVYELLVPTEEMRDLMATSNVRASALRQLALQGGMTSLYEDAIEKAAAGICSVEDVLATAGK